MITIDEIFQADLKTIGDMADHIENTISLEVTAELIDTSGITSNGFKKRLEDLHGKLFAVNHNTGGSNYKQVASMYFTLDEQFLVRLTIANFFQNEPQNIPPTVVDILSETFTG